MVISKQGRKKTPLGTVSISPHTIGQALGTIVVGEHCLPSPQVIIDGLFTLCWHTSSFMPSFYFLVPIKIGKGWCQALYVQVSILALTEFHFQIIIFKVIHVLS